MPEIKKCILLVEDNEKILQGNKRMLERRNYKVATASTLQQAQDILSQVNPDCIVLDIMLPDGSGLDFMQQLRTEKNSTIPILLLTGLAEQSDIVKGFSYGGDDYLVKPYDFQVLIARVQALLRRYEQVPDKVVVDRLSLDIVACVATLDDIDLLLTQKEFAMLLTFCQNKDRYVNGEYLYEKVWKLPLQSNSTALHNTIRRLRSKLVGSDYCITWSRGEGYCFERE